MLSLELSQSACVIVYVTSLKIGHYSISLLPRLVLQFSSNDEILREENILFIITDHSLV